MKEEPTNSKGQGSFAGIIIAALIVGAVALAGGFVISGISDSYNVTVNDSNYTAISNTTQEIVAITNQTGSNFFGNKSTTTQQSAVDRMIGTAYGSILVLGSVPAVFVTSVDSVGGSLGIDSAFTSLMIAGILAIVIGIAIWLAVGRR